jgi:hypothetical protein
VGGWGNLKWIALAIKEKNARSKKMLGAQRMISKELDKRKKRYDKMKQR